MMLPASERLPRRERSIDAYADTLEIGFCLLATMAT